MPMSRLRPTLSVLALTGAFWAAGATPAAARQGTAADCEAMGGTLAAARDAYARSCPSLPRLDCDPIIGGWACASYRLDSTVAGVGRDVTGVGECRWIDATLAGARAGYASLCRPAVRDCDPVPEGWMCSSMRIGLAAPGGAVPDPMFVEMPTLPTLPSDPGGDGGGDGGDGPGPVAPEPGGPGEPTGPDAPDPDFGPEPDPDFGPEPDPDFGPEPSPDGFAPPPAPGASTAQKRLPRVSLYDGRFGEPSVSWADSYSADGVCYAATTGDHGAHELLVATPAGRVTVREALAMIEPGPGISRADALYNDVRCGRGPANDAGDEDRDQCPGRVDLGRAGCATIGPDWRFVR